jgi:hypothetical protein
MQFIAGAKKKFHERTNRTPWNWHFKKKKKKPIGKKFHEGLNLNTIYLLFNSELFHIQGFNYHTLLGPQPKRQHPACPLPLFSTPYPIHGLDSRSQKSEVAHRHHTHTFNAFY